MTMAAAVLGNTQIKIKASAMSARDERSKHEVAVAARARNSDFGAVVADHFSNFDCDAAPVSDFTGEVGGQPHPFCQ